MNKEARHKGIYLIGLAATLIVAAFILAPSAFADTTSGDWTYAIVGEEDSRYAVLTGYTGSDDDLTVPVTVTDEDVVYTVKAIGAEAFEGSTINSISLGSNIESIGESAFENADNLVSVADTEGLKSIGTSAFRGCTHLNSIILYKTIEDIGDEAFSDCSSLTLYCVSGSLAVQYAASHGISHIVLNDDDETPDIFEVGGVTYYGQGTSARVLGAGRDIAGGIEILQTVKTYSVTIISDGAFRSCEEITSVSLPEGIISIGAHAFDRCYALESVNFPAGLTSVGEYAFYESGLKAADLPDSVTEIGRYAFAGSRLESISIPENITELKNVVYGCDQLKSLEIPQSVTTLVGINALGIKTLTIPSSVRGTVDIGFCKALESIVVEADCAAAISIEYCDALSNVQLAETTGELKTLRGCPSLGSIVIPANVSLGRFSHPAFGNFFDGTYVLCVYPDSAALSWAQQNGQLYYVIENEGDLPIISKIGSVRYFTSGDETLVLRCDKDAEGEVVIQGNVNGKVVTKIADSAFRECALVTKVELPVGIVEIGERAFDCCEELKSINLPEGLQKIGALAFQKCAITSIVIPDSVTEIGDSAFIYSALEHVQLSKNLTKINGVFSACSNLNELELHEGIVGISGIDGMGIKTLSIPSSVHGEIYVVACPELESITIQNGCTASFSVRDCASLASVQLADSVDEVTMVRECPKLETLVIPENVGMGQLTLPAAGLCFDGNYVLCVYRDSKAHRWAVANNQLFYVMEDKEDAPKIVISNSVHYFVGDEAVLVLHCDETAEGAIEIQGQVEGKTVTHIANGAFQNMEGVTSVSLPGNVVEIGSNAFKGCSALTSVNLPESLKKIGEEAFYASGLKSVVIPDSVTEIGKWAFAGSALESASLSKNATVLDEVFRDCRSLEVLDVPEGVTKLTGINSIGIKRFIVPTSIQGGIDFYLCDSLESVVVAEGFSANISFEFCPMLTSVILADSTGKLTAIHDCASLRSIRIPKNTQVGPYYKSMKASDCFDGTCVLCVYVNTNALQWARDNSIPYFAMRDTKNPDAGRGTRISGMVRYTDGSPAAGASVRILYNDDVLKESVKTDESGAYAFTFVEVGRYTILAEDDEGLAARNTVSVQRKNVFEVLTTGSSNLYIKNSFSILGMTEPAGEAEIQLTDLNGDVIDVTRSDTMGAFEFESVPNGSYLLKALGANRTGVSEVVVYNNQTEVTIPMERNGASISGKVLAENREGEENERVWVLVTLYDESGYAIGQTFSDENGSYRFDCLPMGRYAIAASMSELRPDSQHDSLFERPFSMNGAVFVLVYEYRDYEAEDIVVGEKKAGTAKIAGKITALGGKQVCEVRLSDIYGNEVSCMKTGANGKYQFENISDGAYRLSASAVSGGYGTSSLVVLKGVVYGETSLKLAKPKAVAEHENNLDALPESGDKDSAQRNKALIVAEKAFYDSLSERDKESLPSEYVGKLSRYIEYLCGALAVSGDANATVDMGGLAVDSAAISEGGDINLALTVGKAESWEIGDDGVESEQDFYQAAIEDASNDKTLAQYYNIYLTSGTGEEKREIDDMAEDLNSTGKIRMTIPIPNDEQGHAEYSLLHVHNGEVETLSDLDDEPNTITAEISTFSTFVLAYSDKKTASDLEDIPDIMDNEIDFGAISLPPGATAMAALYDEKGKMIDIRSTAVSDGGVSFTISDALFGQLSTAKLFSVKGDGNYEPLVETVVLKK